MRTHRARTLLTVGLAAAVSMQAATVHADVTVEQTTHLNVASLIRMHGAMTSNVTADKKREDSESHCEGMMSLFCGNLHGAEIVRLDRGVTWRLQPDKKTYVEEAFATPEEIAQLRSELQANLEKMRSCPVPAQQQTIDKSKCQMSPPKFDIHKTDEKLAIAGHDTQRSVATMTESCTDKESGDVCETVIAMDLWLTQDKLPGSGDKRAFESAYAKKLGMDDAQGVMRAEFARYLGPYQAQIKELTTKSSDLKGTPLKSSLRVLMGGPQCRAMAKTKADNTSATESDRASSANPMNDVAQAGKAIGSALGGLFKKKKTNESQPPADAPAGAPPPEAAPVVPANDPFAQYAQLAAFTTETVRISTDAIPAERFEVPADWKKDIPKPSAKGSDEFTCPKSGS